MCYLASPTLIIINYLETVWSAYKSIFTHSWKVNHHKVEMVLFYEFIQSELRVIQPNSYILYSLKMIVLCLLHIAHLILYEAKTGSLEGLWIENVLCMPVLGEKKHSGCQPHTWTWFYIAIMKKEKKTSSYDD